MAVPAVPARQAVEADQSLEKRQPGEQKHLDQREVTSQQRRHTP